MRVARISHSGVVSAWRQRERELVALGIEVQMVCAARWVEGGGIVELTGSDAARDGFVEPARTIGSHPNLFLFDPRPLWKLLGDRTVDLVDIHEEPFSLVMAEVLLLKWLRRNTAPFVLYSAQNLDKSYPPPFSWIERYALRHSSGSYVCNHAAADRLVRRGLQAPAVVLPLGVDLSLFHPRQRGAPSGSLAVGFVGRLALHKGLVPLVEALRSEPRWSLTLVGDGPDRGIVEERAHELGIADRVTIAGHADQESLAEHYRTFDVLAVPSLPTPSWTEQFGRVAVEAMAAGVPVVTSDAGALPEVVGDAGIVVPAGDAAALHDALAALAHDHDRWDALRAAGLERARRFTWEAVAAAHGAMYASVRR